MREMLLLIVALFAQDAADQIPDAMRRLVCRLAAKLPDGYAEIMQETWLAELDAIPGKILKLWFLLPLLVSLVEIRKAIAESKVAAGEENQAATNLDVHPRRKLYDAFRRVPLDGIRDQQGRLVPDLKFSWFRDVVAPILAVILIGAITVAVYLIAFPGFVQEIDRFIWSLTLEIVLLVGFAVMSNWVRTPRNEEQLALAAVESLNQSFQPQIRDVEYVIQRMEAHVDSLPPALVWLLRLQPLSFFVLTLVGLLGGSVLSVIEIGGSPVTLPDELRRISFFLGVVGLMALWLQHALNQNHQRRTQAAREYLEMLRDRQ
ncbi:hypothetical protein HLB42_20525 (plasmid) [Deinococcus sp. D7000]|nr:hypothetical protein HLB42_20525 [Deinococcus sp. D7000]